MGQYSFATNLKKERTNRGITQHELAAGVHVAQNTVSDWEQCKSYPSIDKIYDIANFLKIPVSKLISDVQKNGCKADCTQKKQIFLKILFIPLDKECLVRYTTTIPSDTDIS